jgi:hypothetical protein
MNCSKDVYFKARRGRKVIHKRLLPDSLTEAMCGAFGHTSNYANLVNCQKCLQSKKSS